MKQKRTLWKQKRECNVKVYLSTKNFTTTTQFDKLYSRYLNKIEKKLTSFAGDLPLLIIVIKKHEKHSFYTATLTLSLPKKTLAVTGKGHTSKEVLHELFEKLFREIDEYKGKHFKGSSKYSRRETVSPRGGDIREVSHL